MISSALQVRASGMCCALGWHEPAVIAALRAHLNHFQHSQFVGIDGLPLVAAAMHDLDIWGPERLILMLRASVAECLQKAEKEIEGLDLARVALILMLPESERAAYPFDALEAVSGEMIGELGLHPESRVGRIGKGGLAGALTASQNLLISRSELPIEAVLLAAVDTLLDAPTIERLLDQGRIASGGNTDGVLPGEGACAIMLTRPRETSRPTLNVVGWSQGRDAWRVGGDVPLRAEALTGVIRETAARANRAVSDFEFHASGMNGEEWYSREIQLALSRAMERKRSDFPHHMIAQYVGETGVAGPLLSLAWLQAAMTKRHRNFGSCGLLHFAGDDGHRCAVAVELSPVSNPSASI